MTKAGFYAWAIPQLINAGITVKLIAKKSQDNCRGYFNADTKELMVAYKNSESFSTFVHEFCHFLQWRDTPKWWDRYSDGTAFVFSWLDRQVTPKSQAELNTKFNLAVALELDCEKRAIRLIKKLKLPINPTVYAQKANAYLAMYSLVQEFGLWPRNKVSTYSDEISQHYPKKLQQLKILRNSKKIPVKAKTLLLQHCFKK